MPKSDRCGIEIVAVPTSIPVPNGQNQTVVGLKCFNLFGKESLASSPKSDRCGIEIQYYLTRGVLDFVRPKSDRCGIEINTDHTWLSNQQAPKSDRCGIEICSAESIVK